MYGDLGHMVARPPSRHVATYLRIPPYISVYGPVYGGLAAARGGRRYTQRYTRGYTRIYRDMRRYTCIYEDIHRYYGMCEAHAHSDIPGYTKGYTSYSAIRG